MTGITALLLFAAWTLLLMMLYVNYRVLQVFTRGTSADTWARDRTATVPGWAARAQHAHLNCVENLPVFGALVLSAHALGQAPVADFAGKYVLVFRLAQSITHLIGVNHTLVMVRGTFFTIQVILFFYMILALV